MKERMTPQEIVQNSTEVKEMKTDWKKVYAALHASIESNKYRVMRHGNTLFWYRIDKPKVAQMYVFNADNYKNLFANTTMFAKAMHKAGYELVYGETQDMNMINLMRRIGADLNCPVEVETIGKDPQGRQLYRGTMHV
jgi:hypothetical protein